MESVPQPNERNLAAVAKENSSVRDAILKMKEGERNINSAENISKEWIFRIAHEEVKIGKLIRSEGSLGPVEIVYQDDPLFDSIVTSSFVEVKHQVGLPYRFFCLFNRWNWRVSFVQCKNRLFSCQLPIKFIYCGKN